MRSFTFIKALLVGLLILLTPEIWAQEKAESNAEKKEVAPPWNAIDLTSADAKLAGGYLPKPKSRIIIPIAAVVVAGVVTWVVVSNNNNNNDDDVDQTLLKANPDEYSVDCGESVTLDVLANDQGDGLEITGAQTAGAVVEVINNMLSVSEIMQEAVEIIYNVKDKYGNTASSTASLIIIFPEIIAVDDNYEADSNADLNGNLLSNDTGQDLNVIDYTQPESGMISIEANGDFLYEPQAGFGGGLQLSYTIQDGCLQTSDAQVTINVTPICDFELASQTTNASCGFADGQITIEVTPDGDYSYQWSDGTTEQNLSNAAAGDYEVNITDLNLNCSLSFDVTLEEDPAVYISDLQINPAICPASGEINFQATTPDGGPLDIHIEFGADIYDISVPLGLVMLSDYLFIESGFYTITASAANAFGDCTELIEALVESQSDMFIDITGTINPSSIDAEDGAIFGIVIAPNPPPFELFVNGLPTIIDDVAFELEGLGIGSYSIYALSPSDLCISDTVIVILEFLASTIPRIAVVTEFNSPPNNHIPELPGILRYGSLESFTVWLEITTGQHWYQPIVGLGYHSNSILGESDSPAWELNAQLNKTLAFKNIEFGLRGGPFAILNQDSYLDLNNFGLLLQPLVQYTFFESKGPLPAKLLIRAGGRLRATKTNFITSFFAGLVFEYSLDLRSNQSKQISLE